MDKYVCTVCGYIYDPEIGDPDNGQPAGTSFEALPDDWTCPVCGVPKSDFEKIQLIGFPCQQLLSFETISIKSACLCMIARRQID